MKKLFDFTAAFSSRDPDVVFYNGKYYALPWSSATQGLVYHEKMFTENGWSVPNTSNELINLAKNVKSKGLTNEYGETVYPFS